LIPNIKLEPKKPAKIALGIAELDSSACAKSDQGEGIDEATAMNQYLQKFQAVRKTLPT
jgi:hypothetical protein